MTTPHLSLHASNRRWFFAAGILLLLLIVYLATHNGQSQDAQPGKAGKRPVPVVLTQVITQPMPIEIKTIGNVESISSVTLKPQTDGQVTGVFFNEGDMVRRGQLLFTIDAQPIEAAIAQAQANVSRDMAQVSQARAQLAKDQAQLRQVGATLKRDQAQLDYAMSQEKRFSNLLGQQFVSESEYEQAVASRRAAEETVSADRAAVQNAQAVLASDRAAIQSAQSNVEADEALVESSRIRLAYSYVRSPMTGRTGSLKVHRGDTVASNNTPMVVIDQIDPIYVGFSLPEQQLNQVKVAAGARPYPVSVTTRGNPPSVLSGRLNFLENAVDTSTGTVRMKASFLNANRLWPGQYVDVTLNLAEEPNALVIPSQAVQSGQKGDYVFVAQQNKAQLRPVIVSRVVNDKAVIASGLRAGEMVVTDGQFQLAPGAPIRLAGKPAGNRRP